MNKIILMGRLTKDPETKMTQNNTVYTKFNIAVNRRFSKENVTDFIPIVAWNKTAEFISMYFEKGSKIAVIGRLEMNKYTAQDGTNRIQAQVIAEEVDFAGNSKKNDESNNAEMFNIESEEDFSFEEFEI